MAYSVKIEPRSGYLEATVTGDNTPQTFGAYVREIYSVCERTGCPRVLIEENLHGPSMSLVDIFEM